MYFCGARAGEDEGARAGVGDVSLDCARSSVLSGSVVGLGCSGNWTPAGAGVALAPPDGFAFRRL